ncbi:DUF4287 domain-containing protein [Actinomyces radicidentis]|uniref:DUF4287 domain-containing protein n=1 Tax=Actinomyces radicidentis TaxID=111015 RepID=UPI0028E32835|nr:DUF4287 domain-containing protein [Actinomyces radicidentis]
MEPRAMMAAVSATLAERTGRSLEQWGEAVQAQAATGAFDVLDQKAVRAWLKSEHGMAQNSQWAVADAAARAAGWEPPTVEEYTEAMYAGGRPPPGRCTTPSSRRPARSATSRRRGAAPISRSSTTRSS